MMSPRSFRLAQRRNPQPSTPSTRSSSNSPSAYSSCSTSPSSPSPIYDFSPTSTPTISHKRWSPKYEECVQPDVAIDTSPARPIPDATMGKRKDRRETSCLSPSSPPTTTTSLTTRPTTPTSPVRIPTNSKRGSFAHAQRRHSSQSQRNRRRDTHDPDSLTPSLMALLAVTDIPRPRQMQRRPRRSDKPLTLDEIIDSNQASEKDLSWNLNRSPLDMLLSPPEGVADNDGDSVSDCNIGSALSTRTLSMDSIPSLGESFTSDPLSSPDLPTTPSPYRGRRFNPMRKSLQPVLSPPGTIDEHPLAGGDLHVDELDPEVLQRPEAQPAKPQPSQPIKPLKFAFKSNLTASLRALRSAAKSFSGIHFPSVPADDLLTRSILTIDTNVPYTDERRPPVSEDMPSAAMRRYLNPTNNARIDSPSSKVAAGTFAASIQMRTYKIQRSRAVAPSSRSLYPSTSLQTTPKPQQPQPQAINQTPPASPGMRQREMRENSDFIRIAVMEMAMRKRGKLDNQRAGRARWALPPMKMSTRPYEITTDGVPARWVPVYY